LDAFAESVRSRWSHEGFLGRPPSGTRYMRRIAARHGITIMVNSLFNGWRFEDAWLGQ
jgi:hypothetical protein